MLMQREPISEEETYLCIQRQVRKERRTVRQVAEAILRQALLEAGAERAIAEAFLCEALLETGEEAIAGVLLYEIEYMGLEPVYVFAAGSVVEPELNRMRVRTNHPSPSDRSAKAQKAKIALLSMTLLVT